MEYKYFFESTDFGFNIWMKYDKTYQSVAVLFDGDYELDKAPFLEYSEDEIVDELESDLIDITDIYLNSIHGCVDKDKILSVLSDVIKNSDYPNSVYL